MQYAIDKSDFLCLIPVIEKMVENYQDPWCNGQNTFAFFNEEAQKIDASMVTEYDDSINNLLLEAVALYVEGVATKEDAIQSLKDDVANAFPNLIVE